MAVAGGSVMDGTKFVASAAEYTGEQASDLLLNSSSQKLLRKTIPLGAVVTLPATSSEMNCTGVISYAGAKFDFANNLFIPNFRSLIQRLHIPYRQVRSLMAL